MNIEEKPLEYPPPSEESSFSFINYIKTTGTLLIFPKKAINDLSAHPTSIKTYFFLTLFFGTLRFFGEYYYWLIVIGEPSPNLTHPINIIAGWTQISTLFLLGVTFSSIFLLDFLSAKITKSEYRYRVLISIFGQFLVIYTIVSVIDISLTVAGISTFFHYPIIVFGSIMIDFSSVYITIGQIFMAIILSYLTFVSILILYKKLLNAILCCIISGFLFNLIMISQIPIGYLDEILLLNSITSVGDQFHWFSLWMLDNIYFILLLIPFYLIYLFKTKKSIKRRFSSFPLVDFGIFLITLVIGYFIAGKQLQNIEFFIFILIAFLICLNASLNRKWWNKENILSKNEYFLLNFFIISLSLCLAGLISLFSVLILLFLNLYSIMYPSYKIKLKEKLIKQLLHPIIKYLSFFFLIAVEITPFNKMTEFPFSLPSVNIYLGALGIIISIFFLFLFSKIYFKQ